MVTFSGILRDKTEWGAEGVVPSKEGTHPCQGPGLGNLRHVLGCPSLSLPGLEKNTLADHGGQSPGPTGKCTCFSSHSTAAEEELTG